MADDKRGVFKEGSGQRQCHREKLVVLCSYLQRKMVRARFRSSGIATGEKNDECKGKE